MSLYSYPSLLKFLPCHKLTNIERNGSYGSRFESFIKSEESFISKCLDKAIENPFIFLISLRVHDPSFYDIYRWYQYHHHSDESSSSWWHKITVKIVFKKFIFQDSSNHYLHFLRIVSWQLFLELGRFTNVYNYIKKFTSFEMKRSHVYQSQLCLVVHLKDQSLDNSNH